MFAGMFDQINYITAFYCIIKIKVKVEMKFKFGITRAVDVQWIHSVQGGHEAFFLPTQCS